MSCTALHLALPNTTVLQHVLHISISLETTRTGNNSSLKSTLKAVRRNARKVTIFLDQKCTVSAATTMTTIFAMSSGTHLTPMLVFLPSATLVGPPATSTRKNRTCSVPRPRPRDLIVHKLFNTSFTLRFETALLGKTLKSSSVKQNHICTTPPPHFTSLTP